MPKSEDSDGLIKQLKHQVVILIQQRNLLLLISIVLFSSIVALCVWFITSNKTQQVISQETTNKLVELAKDEERNKPVTIASDFGYTVSYNPRVWKQGSLTISLTNVEYTNLDLIPSGSARVSISSATHSSSELTKKWRTDNDKSLTDLDLWVKHYRDGATSGDGKILSSEKIKRWGVDAYKITLETTILGYKAKSYQYLTIVDGWPFAVLASYTQYGNSGQIAESLIDTVKFYNPTNKVKGASTTQQPANVLDEVKVSDLNKPSTVSILNITCDKFQVNEPNKNYIKSEYNFCIGGQGSGFILTSDGYVGTNGHVAKVPAEDAILDGIQSGSLAPFVVDLIRELSFETSGNELSEDDAKAKAIQLLQEPSGVDALIQATFSIISHGLASVQEDKGAYFVKLGNLPFEINDTSLFAGDLQNAVKVDPSILTATLIDYDYSGIVPVNFDGTEKEKKSDVAIIKLDNPQKLVFPAVKLGDASTLREGMSIIVVGYPGLVSGDNASGRDSLIDYEKSSAKPTVTRGIVSAIKTDSGGKKLIQTDASIDHGNSGGPAFDSFGNVIGIATYGFSSEGGNYNFLRDIDDMKALMTKNSIIINGSNPTYTAWQTGLENFWSQHYKKSNKYFGDVKKSYPMHSSVDQFIADANSAIGRGEDKGGLFADLPLLPIIIIGIVLVVSVGGGVTYLVLRKKHSAVVQSPPVVTVPPPTPGLPPQPPMTV